MSLSRKQDWVFTLINLDFQQHTRLLDEKDLPEILEILNLHTNIGKVPFQLTSEDYHAWQTIYMNNPMIRVIGYFEKNILVTFLVQQLSDKIPAWHMVLLSTRSEHRWNYKLNGLEYCWANAMHFAEEQKIFRIYWSLPEAWVKSQHRTINTSDVWKRYEIYIDDIIKPNEFPMWSEHRPAFGKNPKPHNTVIKTGLLKNEYRRIN